MMTTMTSSKVYAEIRHRILDFEDSAKSRYELHEWIQQQSEDSVLLHQYASSHLEDFGRWWNKQLKLKMYKMATLDKMKPGGVLDHDFPFKQLGKAYLKGLKFFDHAFVRVSFDGAFFDECLFENCYFTSCGFDGVSAKNTTWNSCYFNQTFLDFKSVDRINLIGNTFEQRRGITKGRGSGVSIRGRGDSESILVENSHLLL